MLRTEPAGPTYHTDAYGAVPALDLTALHDEPAGSTAVFAVNRDSEDLELNVDLRAMPALSPIEHLCIAAAAEPMRSTARATRTAFLPAVYLAPQPIARPSPLCSRQGRGT